MGQPSDLYRLKDKATLELKDLPSPRYLWLDRQIKGPQNTLHANIFRQNNIEISKFDSFEGLNKEVERSPIPPPNLRVLCAASFDDTVYQRMQANNKIERVFLFCRDQNKAMQLLQRFSKIILACYSSGDVMGIIKIWEKEDQISMFVFNEEGIQGINRHYANVLSITDRKNIVMEYALDNFQTYVKKIVSNERRSLGRLITQFERSIINAQLMVTFLQNCLIKPNDLIETLNQLLKATSKPDKLAYLRYIVSGLFDAIKDSYLKDEQLPINQYYAYVEFSQAEFAKLQQSKQRYFMFAYFLHAKAQRPSRSLKSFYQANLIINIPKKQRDTFSTGYFQRQSNILFNLGNYFKIDQYNPLTKTLSVTLLEIPGNIEPSLDDDRVCIYLNRIHQKRFSQKYDGQWSALLTNHCVQQANQYIADKLKVLSNAQQTTQVKEKILKYRMSQTAYKLKNNHANALDQYELLINQLEKDSQIIMLIQCFYMELVFLLNQPFIDVNRFNRTFTKFERHNGFFIAECQKHKQKVVRFAYDIINAHDRQQRLQILADLQEFQRIFKRVNRQKQINRQSIYSQLYPFLLKVKLKALTDLNQTLKAQKVLLQLKKLWIVCEGTLSPEIFKLNQFKYEIQARRKKKLFKSKVRLEELSVDSYLVDRTLDLTLYE